MGEKSREHKYAPCAFNNLFKFHDYLQFVTDLCHIKRANFELGNIIICFPLFLITYYFFFGLRG